MIQEPGKDIWLFGGASIISQLLNTNLIDELIIVVQPIVLGKGIPLFKEIIHEKYLKLNYIREIEPGLAELSYTVVKE